MQLYSRQEMQYILGDKIGNIRKYEKKMTQKEMSVKADVPLSTYARMEQLGEGSLKDFFKVLQALGRGNELDKILVMSKESPVEVYERMKKEGSFKI